MMMAADILTGFVAVLHGATSLAVQLQLESAAREAAREAVVEPEAAAERASSAARVVAGDRIRTVDTDVGDEWISVTITASVVVIPMLGLERTLEAGAVMRREDRIG